jgi:hypothetical protein
VHTFNSLQVYQQHSPVQRFLFHHLTHLKLAPTSSLKGKFVRVYFIKHHSTQTHGVWRCSSTMLDLSTQKEVSCQLSTPAALPLRKEPPVPLHRRLGRPQSWTLWSRKENLCQE